MGWLFGRKKEPADANELLRQHHEAEAARLTARQDAYFSSVADAPGELIVQDVFRITGRGLVATGKVEAGVLRVGDDVALLREGGEYAKSQITGLESARRRSEDARAGANVGVLLRGGPEVRSGDRIRVVR